MNQSIDNRNWQRVFYVWLFACAIAIVTVRIMGSFLFYGHGTHITHMGVLLPLPVAVLSLAVYYLKAKVDWSLVAFIGACAISIAVNWNAMSHDNLLRFGYFVLTIVCIAPLFTNRQLNRWRRLLWHCWTVGLRVCVILAIRDLPEWLTVLKTDCFGGCLVNSMLMGFAAGVVALDSAYRLLCRDIKWSCRLFFFLLVAAAGYELICSGNRMVMTGVTLGGIVLLWHARRQVKRCLLLGGAVAVTCAICAVTPRSTGGLLKKYEIASSHGSFTYSHDALWQLRLDEFESEPVAGIGFGNLTETVDIDPTKYLPNHEPGTSWLFLLSSTGLLGFLTFLWYNVKVVKRLLPRKNRNGGPKALYGALFIMLAVNGITEGWILAAGSFHFLTYWLLTSMILQNDEGNT